MPPRQKWMTHAQLKEINPFLFVPGIQGRPQDIKLERLENYCYVNLDKDSDNSNTTEDDSENLYTSIPFELLGQYIPHGYYGTRADGSKIGGAPYPGFMFKKNGKYETINIGLNDRIAVRPCKVGPTGKLFLFPYPQELERQQWLHDFANKKPAARSSARNRKSRRRSKRRSQKKGSVIF